MMKNKIYITGLITTMIVFMGGIFKLNHFPGAGIMLTLGMLMLIFLFLPLALTNHYRAEGNRQNLLLYIVTWLTCLVVFGSMLFKIQHWPGAGKLLMIALPFPYVVFLPVFLAVTARNKNFSIHNTVFVLFLLSGISVFSVLLSLNVSKERIDDSLNLSRNYNRIETVLDGIPASAGQDAVAQKIDNLIGVVDGYQSRIFAAEGITENDWNRDPLNFPRLESTGVAFAARIWEKDEPTPDLALESGLKDLIRELETKAGNEKLAKAVPVIFEYMDYPDAGPGEWTKQMLVFSPVAWSMIWLDGLETNLKLLRAGIK
ncbi:MAG: hypothetical protein P1P83_13200 [Bacteroidales bacterium]|nr:hypothetical protein [Bacteroidales bacterium]MDT8372387.1 hypothetical protein [Bacteroidales bacterium]